MAEGPARPTPTRGERRRRASADGDAAPAALGSTADAPGTPAGDAAARRHELHRKRLIGTVVAVAAVIGLIAGGPWLYARFLAPEPADPLVLATPTPVAAPTPPGPVDIEGTWSVGEGSQAGYRLGEVLSGEPVTVVGRTEDVTGTLVVQDGLLTEAEVTVDVGSITTDESARDAYFRRALDTSAFPEASFALTEPVDVSAVADTEAPVAVSVPGELTFHGVTRPVTAALEVARVDGVIQVAGAVDVALADYDLAAPDLGFVTVEPSGTVEMLLQLTR